MADMASALQQPKSRRRWPLPRFSLAAALVAMTLCAVGLWYWYRVPFEVVHDQDRNAQGRKRGDTYREVETVRRTWDGTIRHGPRRIYLNDKLYVVENYSDGVPHGKWEWLDGAGHATITAEFRLGKLESFRASPECDQRLAQLLAEGAIDDPNLVRQLLMNTRIEFRRTPFMHAIQIVKEFSGAHLTMQELRKASPPDGVESWLELPVTCKAEGPLIEVLASILRPLGLVCDYRYGMLSICPSVGVEEWQDPTGVTTLTPPAGSNLAANWNSQTSLEFIETPLKNALQIVTDIHGVKFDLSHLPAEPIQRLPYGQIVVTYNVSGITLKNGLGAMLDAHDLQARLDGETIVIELQPDHPLAEKPQALVAP
jgi:hypothetical protein